jgi:REP element-mobilizing transposase RayT
MIAYMLTLTTYGTWLQGDERGYVKDSVVLGGNENLELANKNQQICRAVRLNSQQKQIVKTAIESEAERIGQKIYALAVCSNHIHIVLENSNEKIPGAISRYKNKSTKALKRTGLSKPVWTRKYDKRFIYDNEHLQRTIDYVEKHNNPI